MKIMIYKIIRIISKAVFLAAIYAVVHAFYPFADSLLNFPELFVALLIYFTTEHYWTEYISKFWQKIILPEIWHGQILINSYNQKLNTIIQMKDIIDNFIYLNQHLFASANWALYWSKTDMFELTGDSFQKQEIIPHKIVFHEKNHLREFKKDQQYIFTIHELIEQDLEMGKSLASISEKGLFQFVIPVKSFQNLVGLLFVDSSLENLVKIRELRLNLIKIIKKTSEISEKINLHEELAIKSMYNERLLEVSKLIASSLDLNDVLTSIMKAVYSFVPSDAAAIFIVDNNSTELKYQYVTGYDLEEIKHIHIKLNQGIVGKVIQSGVPSIIQDVRENEDYYAMRQTTLSQLTIPLYSGNIIIGAIVLESDHINHFNKMDMEILKTFAGHASIAINNAWLYKDAREKKELESDLLIASNIQKSLLINRPPHLQGINIGISSIPCKLIGGDFYDIQRSNEFKTLISIGDVAGKGAPGALLMAVVMAGLRSFYKQVYSVCEVIARVNNLMCEATTPGKYATMFLAAIDYQKKEIVYTNAGHNPPALIHKDGSVEWLTGGGIVVGFIPNSDYQQFRQKVQPDDILFLYTDGLVEAQNDAGEEFGNERLIDLLISHKDKSITEQKKVILDGLKHFTDFDEFEDDLTFLIFKFTDDFFKKVGKKE